MYPYSTIDLWDFQEGILYKLNNIILSKTEKLFIIYNFSLTLHFACDIMNMLGRLWAALFSCSVTAKRNDP